MYACVLCVLCARLPCVIQYRKRCALRVLCYVYHLLCSRIVCLSFFHLCSNSPCLIVEILCAVPLLPFILYFDLYLSMFIPSPSHRMISLTSVLSCSPNKSYYDREGDDMFSPNSKRRSFHLARAFLVPHDHDIPFIQLDAT